jgi:hypothetical protein
MRTTVTLDPEVERLLKKAMRLRGQSFKQALNQALLKGLADLADDQQEPSFEVAARSMRLRAGIDSGRLNALADELEAEAHVALTRRLLAARESGDRS